MILLRGCNGVYITTIPKCLGRGTGANICSCNSFGRCSDIFGYRGGYTFENHGALMIISGFFFCFIPKNIPFVGSMLNYAEK